MRIIRASDITNYNYCQRAFWYSIKGYEPENLELVENGLVHHNKLARQISFSRLVRLLALGLATLGVTLIILEILIL